MTKEFNSKKRQRFLLIDDDPIYRAIILRCAKAEGIDLDVFESLMDVGCITLLGQYDAAILDYDLGNLNGTEIADYLSALFGDIPMILVSDSDRTPGIKGWPTNIKKFMRKSDGFAATLKEAVKFSDLRGSELGVLSEIGQGVAA